jgi:hypothetical protein
MPLASMTVRVSAAKAVTRVQPKASATTTIRVVVDTRTVNT